ncbi:MAG: glycosyltransferase [Patescibacteria group bacterium]
MKNPSLILISPYPKRGTLYNKTHGIVSFAKNTVTSIYPHMKKLDKSIVVIADKTSHAETYAEKGVYVERAFEKNKFSMYLEIFKKLLKYNKTKDLLVEFDFSLYGDFYVVSLFPFFLLFLKLLGYRTNLVLHAVILDLKKIGPHLGYGNDLLSKVKIQIFTMCIKVFYLLFSFTTQKIIILENAFVAELKKINPRAKIVFVPHGVDLPHRQISYLEARKKLGFTKNEFVATSFGFVVWYKGADFLVNNFSKSLTIAGKKIKFILAGGKTPPLASKQYYKEYYAKISRKIQKSKNIKLTGFVDEKDISTYYAASDLMIFPYRAFMAASGPLSFALSYKKPFILSDNFRDIKKNIEFSDAMIKANLTDKDIFFPMTKKGIVTSIKNFQNPQKMKNMKYFSKRLYKQYTWKKLGKLWYENIIEDNKFYSQSLHKSFIKLNSLLSRHNYT